jgi:hypothetical protein
MNKFNMQNVFLWIKNKNKGGYKFRYENNLETIDGYLGLQIENSLRLGWSKSDIVLITNFSYSYMGIEANTIDEICGWSAFANKMVAVDQMVKKGVINDNFWIHDCDAYQLQPFTFPEFCKDVGFVRHAPNRVKLQGGSVFYRKEAQDIISVLSEGIKLFKINKEESFFPLFYNTGCKEKYLEQHKKDDEKAEYVRKYFEEWTDRFTWLNWTYNLFRQRQFSIKYPEAQKPIKVVHFHPEDQSCLDCFYYGRNSLNVKVVTPELKNLFIKHELVKK